MILPDHASLAAGSCFSSARRLAQVAAVLALALSTLLIYLPVRHHGFITLDDGDYFYANPEVQAGLTWEGVKWAFTTGRAGNWHPLTWLSHMFDAQLFGSAPSAPHTVNVLFHLANTLLLFGWLERRTGAIGRSAVVAALFALHPLRVESVAWVAERKDMLGAFFFLLTLYAYSHYTNSLAARRRRIGWYVTAWFAFVGGLLSKPMVVTLPFVLLLVDRWPLRRTPTVGLKEKGPFFLLSAISCLVTLVVQQRAGAVSTLKGFPPGERIANALVSYARYLDKTFWPADLAVFYPHPGPWPTRPIMLAAILVAGLCFAAWQSRHRFPFIATGWFWFFGMLVPTIGVVQVGLQAMADRYTYLPSIGLFIAIIWGVGSVFAHRRLPREMFALAAGVVLMACALRTTAQLAHWRTSEVLFRHALAVTGENFIARYSLGSALLEQGRIDEAIAEFRQTLALQPRFAEAENNLGGALLRQGHPDEAMAQFRKAVASRPDFALAHYNLATILLQRGRADEASAEFERTVALQPGDFLSRLNFGNALLQQGATTAALAQYSAALVLRPHDSDAHNNLGQALLREDRTEEAIGQFQQALKFQPGHANAHYNLGEILMRRGQPDEASTHFEMTLSLQPDDGDAHGNLGLIRLGQGRPREAAAHLRAALHQQPDSIGLLANLAWLRATCSDSAVRDGAEAIELAEQANRLSNSRSAAILRTLAAAYAENRRFDDAVTIAQRALRQASSESNVTLLATLTAQIKFHQAGSPYRDTANTGPLQ